MSAAPAGAVSCDLHFVGSKEKEKYGDALNESLLQSIGDIVYQDTASGTYILQVQDT